MNTFISLNILQNMIFINVKYIFSQSPSLELGYTLFVFNFSLFFKKFYLFCLFISGCVGSSLLHAGFLQLCRRASHCGGLPYRGARALGAQASAVAVHGLSSCGLRAPEHRLSSCSTRAQLLRSMWDPSRPGLEPMSPARAGGLSTAAPPGKP